MHVNAHLASTLLRAFCVLSVNFIVHNFMPFSTYVHHNMYQYMLVSVMLVTFCIFSICIALYKFRSNKLCLMAVKFCEVNRIGLPLGIYISIYIYIFNCCA